MATTIYPTVPVAQPDAETWPVDDHPIGIQADEMFARQLDTGFAGEIRILVHDPETGLAGKYPEGALGGVAEAIPAGSHSRRRRRSTTASWPSASPTCSSLAHNCNIDQSVPMSAQASGT